MDIKSKQQWSVKVTNFLLTLWSSTEVQNKLEGATRPKPVLEQKQHEMAAAGCETLGEMEVISCGESESCLFCSVGNSIQP